jgi:hypothetical protein
VNVGTKVTFKIVSPNTGSVLVTSSANNIFSGTSSIPSSAAPNTGSHTIYPTPSVTFTSTSTTAAISGTTLTLTGATPPTLTIGTLLSGTGVTANTLVTAILTATTYTVNNSQTSNPTSYLIPILTSHTFMALPTTIGGSAYGFGWFQLGNV